MTKTWCQTVVTIYDESKKYDVMTPGIQYIHFIGSIDELTVAFDNLKMFLQIIMRENSYCCIIHIDHFMNQYTTNWLSSRFLKLVDNFKAAYQ